MTRFIKPILFAVVLFLLVVFSPLLTTKIEASSSHYLNFENITTKDGLSNNYIKAIFQDRYGYIWIGTMRGLNKSDGREFQVFDNKSSISNSDIRVINETSDGQLWVGTQKGLNVFNYKTKTFSVYLNNPDNPNSISNDSITAIFEDSYDRLWIGTKSGLNVFDYATGTFSAYLNDPQKPNSISNDTITAIFEDSRGMLWIGTEKGLNVFDYATGTFSAYLNDPQKPNCISNDTITAIFEDSRGMLWIGTKSGLNVFDYATGMFSVYLNDPNIPNSISNDDVSSICEDNSGYLWIGTYIGLNKLDVYRESFTVYTTDIELGNTSINNNRIQTIYKDIDGVLWIGTINGVNILNFSNQVFGFYPFDYSTVYAIDSDDSNLWMQVGLDLVKFNIESETIETSYPSIFEFIEIKADRKSGVSLAPAFRLSVDGYIWIGTTNSGMKRLNPITGDIKEYLHVQGDNNSLPSNNITAFYVSHEGTVWIGTEAGLCSLNPQTDEITQYKDNLKYPEAIRNGPTYHIYETSDNDLWFSTLLNTYKFDSVTNEFTNITSDTELGSIGGFNYCSMCESSNSLLWIGKGNELYCYDLEKEQFIPFDEGKKTVSFDHIYGLLDGNNGDIWITTIQGLWRLSIKNSVYTYYSLEDGLESDTFRPLSCYKTKDGTFYLGCLTGLVFFNPENIEEDAFNPRVLISDFRLLDKSLSFDKPIEDIQEITLPYSDNSFIINFVDNNFSSSAKTLFAYKLDGFDTDWNYCNSDENSAKYTNIPNGEYTFLVKATDNNDNWDTKSLSLKIHILSPFWKEWWFILLLFGVGAISIIIIIKLKTRALHLRAQELEAQVEKKTAQLAEKTIQLEEELNQRVGFTRVIVHELKTPITSLQIANELLLEEAKESPFLELANSIENSINSLEERTNELLDIIRGEMGLLKIDIHSIDLDAYFSKVSCDMLLLAKNKGKNLAINIQDSLGIAECDAERISQVINNLIDNANKFTTEQGIVRFSARAEDSHLVVSISDDGCGISEDRQKYIFVHGLKSTLPISSDLARFNGLGIGLVLSKLIIDLHGGKISVESKVNKGSVFTFSIPYKHSLESNLKHEN